MPAPNIILIGIEKKFAITKATSLDDALGMLPSIAPPNPEFASEERFTLGAQEASEKFKSALSEDTQLIQDKARARYVLYRAEPSQELLDHGLRLLPRQPEHIDAFVQYLRNYKKSRRIVEVCLQVLQTTPYDYVLGETWHLLAKLMPSEQMRELIPKAIETAKNGRMSFVAKWGACHFLCTAEHRGLGHYAEFVKYQKTALLQALLVFVLPEQRFASDRELIVQLLRRSDFEPGIALAAAFIHHGLTLLDFPDVKVDLLHTQARNVFRAVGIIDSESGPIDPIGEILTRRYGTQKWTGWKRLFGSKYNHAAQLLSQADAVFDSGRSFWLSHQNSFNNVLFLALQTHLNKKGLPGAMKTVGAGKLLKFGLLVDANQKFAKHYPTIAEAFRKMNTRRNSLPGSHPYEEKGGIKTKHLQKGEQVNLVHRLSVAYANIIVQFSSLFT